MGQQETAMNTKNRIIGDRDRERLACGRSELDYLRAVILRTVDQTPLIPGGELPIPVGRCRQNHRGFP